MDEITLEQYHKLADIADDIFNNILDIPEEIQEVINENFWNWI